jgi:predicted Zn-ribbon and HTH transcriptional regulator
LKKKANVPDIVTNTEVLSKKCSSLLNTPGRSVKIGLEFNSLFVSKFSGCPNERNSGGG